jgi:hypothetical protein
MAECKLHAENAAMPSVQITVYCSGESKQRIIAADSGAHLQKNWFFFTTTQ